MIKFTILLCTSILIFSTAFCQEDTVLYFKGAIKKNRITQYNNLVKNTITKNLSLPLTDSTEENWQDAMWAMEVLQFKSPWANNQVQLAFDSAEKRSTDFQRALLELAYTNYPKTFDGEIIHLAENTTDDKIFALCVEYLLQSNQFQAAGINTKEKIKQLVNNQNISPVLQQLSFHLNDHENVKIKKVLPEIFKKDFLKNNVLLLSFQRKNRNFPGLALIRDKEGNFMKDANGSIIGIPQLARSISNLPGYLRNGNTAQGFYRMFGTDVSKANYIGPTPDIQLTMPFETSIQHFLKDSSITDTIWTEKLYETLLPKSLKNYFPAYQTFYASKIGRTEIIAHGTTIDPGIYESQPFYPLTPTQGCLCTKELWSEETGRLIESDQYKLVNTIKAAGGADGYCLVIELDDQEKPVLLEELLPFIKN